jgi:hypothetical protein
MPREPKDFDTLAKLLPELIAAVTRLLYKDFKLAPRQKRYKTFALIVLNDLMRKSESVAAMVAAGAYAGVNVVARSAFETYADLVNLFKHSGTYPEYMLWMSHGQQKTVLESLVNPDSPYADAFAADARAYGGPPPKELLAHIVSERDAIAVALPDIYKTSVGDVRDRDIFRFELAGLRHEYGALYRQLSGGAHDRVSSMGEGIFPPAEDGLQWPPSKSLVSPPLMALNAACEMLHRSGRLVARKFAKPTAVLDRLGRRLDEIRGDRPSLL